MRGGSLFGVDFGVGLDPLAAVGVGDFVVIALGEGGHDIDAQDAVVSVVLGIDMDAEIDIDRTPLLAHGLPAKVSCACLVRHGSLVDEYTGRAKNPSSSTCRSRHD